MFYLRVIIFFNITYSAYDDDVCLFGIWKNLHEINNEKTFLSAFNAMCIIYGRIKKMKRSNLQFFIFVREYPIFN